MVNKTFLLKILNRRFLAIKLKAFSHNAGASKKKSHNAGDMLYPILCSLTKFEMDNSIARYCTLVSKKKSFLFFFLVWSILFSDGNNYLTKLHELSMDKQTT